MLSALKHWCANHMGVLLSVFTLRDKDHQIAWSAITLFQKNICNKCNSVAIILNVIDKINSKCCQNEGYSIYSDTFEIYTHAMFHYRENIFQIHENNYFHSKFVISYMFGMLINFDSSIIGKLESSKSEVFDKSVLFPKDKEK